MSSSRKKTAFYGLLITAGGVLAVCVIIFKDPFVEHLLLSRLESGSRIDKLEAAFSLVDRRSERAIPLIVENVRQDIVFRPDGFRLLSRLGKSGALAILRFFESEDSELSANAATAIQELGGLAEEALGEYLDLLGAQGSDPDWHVSKQLEDLFEHRSRKLTEWIDLLESPDAWIRFQAICSIRQYENFKLGAPALRSVLNDPSWFLRKEVVYALGTFESKSSAFVDDLLVPIQDGNADERAIAIEALAKVDPNHTPAVPLILKASRDEDVGVRSAAVSYLAEVTPGTEEIANALVAVLKDKEENLRGLAAEALGGYGDHGDRVVPDLLTLLQDPEDAVRLKVIEVLGEFKAQASEIVPALRAALADKNSEVRYYALDELGGFGRAAAVAIPEIIAALGDADADVTSSAIVALGLLGPDPADVVPRLVEAFESIPDQRDLVSSAFVQVGADPATVFPLLVEELGRRIQLEDSGKVSDLVDAMNALYVPDAALDALLPEMLEFCADSGHSHGLHRLWATMGPRAKTAVPHLLARLDEDESNWYFATLDALATIGDRADEITSRMIRALERKTTDYELRKTVLEVLASLGPRAADAAAVVLAELEHGNRRIREAACTALAALGASDEDTVNALAAVLQDLHSQVRRSAVDALGELGRGSENAARALGTALGDAHVQVRYRAVVALGRIGDAARAARAELEQATKNEDESVRKAAARVLADLAE